MQDSQGSAQFSPTRLGLINSSAASRSSPIGRQKHRSYNLLAKPRIEVETAGIFNFDFAEIVMLGIEEKRSFRRHNHTRNGKNHGMTRANPIVANIPVNGTLRLAVP